MALLAPPFLEGLQKRDRVYFCVLSHPVCDICCDGGSMYDPIGGQYRYEYIIDRIMALYGDSWEKETKLSKDRMKSHTAKYTKSRKRK